MNANIIKGLLLLSCVFLLLMITSFFVIGKKWTKGKSIKKILLVSMFLLLSIWSLRYSVGYYSHYNPNDEIPAMALNEEVFNSLVHTLQSFSMDEGYTEYVVVGKDMMTAITHEGSIWITLYGVYASMLNVFAVIAGGAILFDLLSEFFPKLRILVAKASFWKKKYYFSELNDRAIALATNIQQVEKNGPVFIFADAYVDDEDEASSERMLSAQTMGGICVKDDLMHLGLKQVGISENRIFLIDENENNNIQTLSALLREGGPVIENSEIYVFSTDDYSSNMDEELSYIINQYKEKIELPTIVPVNGIRNMVVNLLRDVPLYEPLINNPSQDSVNVTIIGSGTIGTEFFINTYWYGQILGKKLHVSMISNEKRNRDSNFDGEGDFEGKINGINPDILKSQTGQCPDGEMPYFTFEYKECDVLNGDLSKALEKDESNPCAINLLDTDYFVVALGSDEDNFAFASMLKKYVGLRHLELQSEHRTIINYVIYDTELCRSLNGLCGDNENPDDRRNSRNGCRFYYTQKGTEEKIADVYMHAFGALEDVYGVENVFFEKVLSAAESSGKIYGTMHEAAIDGKAIRKTNQKRFRDVYSFEANIGRATHGKYKIFAANCFKRSLFNEELTSEENSVELNYEKEQGAALARYLKFLYEDKKDEKGVQMIHDLAWMEHRRWVAIMRVKGFRDPEVVLGQGGTMKYLSLSTKEHDPNDGQYKFLSLKLHNCMVESNPGIRAYLDDYGNLMSETEYEAGWKERWKESDPLDKVSDARWEENSSSEDYKRWDYPGFLFSLEEAQKYHDPADQGLTKYCEGLSALMFGQWYDVMQSAYRFVRKDGVHYFLSRQYFVSSCTDDVINKYGDLIGKEDKKESRKKIRKAVEERLDRDLNAHPELIKAVKLPKSVNVDAIDFTGLMMAETKSLYPKGFVILDENDLKKFIGK